MMRRVVVTGIGLLTPLDAGSGKEAFWSAITSGVNAVGEVTLFNTSGYSSSVAGEVKGFETGPKDRWYAFLDKAFTSAVEDSGLGGLPDGAGLILGTVLGGILKGEAAWKQGSSLPEEYRLSSGADRLAETFFIRGPVTTVSTACASGTDAIGIALRLIQSGRADVMIAGGGDVLSEFAFSGFSSLNALTKDLVRPFAGGRTGLALGEGAAFLVIEEERHASKRGARAYCRISGYSSSADANHMTGPDKEARGLSKAIRAALDESECSRVDYVNAHGTGTPYNDLMETKAFKNVFGNEAYGIPVSSIKSMIGHSFGAAGAIEAAACVMVMERGLIPPTINLVERDPECDLDYCPAAARKTDVRSCLTVSAGFGGQNSALVLTGL